MGGPEMAPLPPNGPNAGDDMTDLPGSMRAQVLRAWGDALAHETVATPRPRAGGALVRVEACGVRLTALHYMNGNQARRAHWLPRTRGHELDRTVVELGEG